MKTFTLDQMRTDDKRKSHTLTEATYTRLLQRWNTKESQANVWLLGGIGARFSLHVLDRQFVLCAFVKGLQHLRGDARLDRLAAYREALAAPRDADVERVFDLAQVFVERAAQVGEALVELGTRLDLELEDALPIDRFHQRAMRLATRLYPPD